MKQINRVLVIDDDKDDQQFLHKAIHDLFPNMECISLSNGKEALKFIEENPPPPSYFWTCLMESLYILLLNEEMAITG